MEIEKDLSSNLLDKWNGNWDVGFWYIDGHKFLTDKTAFKI